MAINRLPWGYGGTSYPYGSFAGRASSSRPFLGVVTAFRFGFGGRVPGSFSGRGVSRTGGPFTVFTPYGYGGRRYGSFSGRVTALPIGSGVGSFAISGTTPGRLVIGDYGGPYYEVGYFALNGTGSAILQTGARVGSGTGSLRIVGTGLAVSESSGEVAATGSGSIGLSGNGLAYGPTITSSGSGSISFVTGSSVATTRNPGMGEYTLADILNVIFNTEIESGVTFATAIKAMAAVTAGKTNGGAGTVTFSAIGNPETTRVLGTATETGARDNIVLP